MPLTEDQRIQIRDDLISVFQSKYGDDWVNQLIHPLRPSPLKQIAKDRGVPVCEVKRVRKQLLSLGLVLQALFIVEQ